MKIIHYCQHILGMGHLFRSLEIARALSGHQVLMVTGGEDVDAPWPDHVRRVALPALVMDPEFSQMTCPEPGRSVTEVQEERKKRLADLMAEFQPDVFLVELFPFGRNAFRFELLPVLEEIKATRPEVLVVSSLRDVLVEKEDPEAYETRVLGHLNRHFDLLLVHSDPNCIRLDETFSRVEDILIPVVYTGFVAPVPTCFSREEARAALGLRNGQGLVVASAGGGRVGFPLMDALIRAHARWPERECFDLVMFTGPFLEAGAFDRLVEEAGPGIQVLRFTPDFSTWLTAADLSVSMAGYNTCANLAACGPPALVWPFGQNREQRHRARALGLGILNDEDLAPEALARHMTEAISRGRGAGPRMDLSGAIRTAEAIERHAALRRKDQ